MRTTTKISHCIIQTNTDQDDQQFEYGIGLFNYNREIEVYKETFHWKKEEI